jgi:hypothetical protein
MPTPLNLRVIGPIADENEAPASVLLQTLSGLQNLVWLFGHLRTGGSLVRRMRFATELKQRFTLRLSPPRAGSFLLPGFVRSEEPQLVDVEIEPTVETLLDFCSAAASGRAQELDRLVPDRTNRRFALDQLRNLAPLPGSGYTFEISNGNGKRVELRDTLQSKVDRMLELEDASKESPLYRVVTGTLTRIDFDDRNLTILYAPTGRELTCEYDEDAEQMLFENRRDRIQVRGKVRLGEDDHPTKIVEVDFIGDLDLSPFTLNEISWNNRQLRFRNPLTLSPSLDETEQLICLYYEQLNLSASAPLRTQLLDDVHECVAFLWEQYALESDAKMTPKAQALRNALLQAIEEVSGKME